MHMFGESVATLEPRSVDRANQELGVEAVEACASHCSDTIRRRLFWLTWPLLPSSQVDLFPISDEPNEESQHPIGVSKLSGDRPKREPVEPGSPTILSQKLLRGAVCRAPADEAGSAETPGVVPYKRRRCGKAAGGRYIEMVMRGEPPAYARGYAKNAVRKKGAEQMPF